MADDLLKTALDVIRAVDASPALSLLSEAERGARKGYAPYFSEEEIDAADNAVTALDLARMSLLAVVDATLKLAAEWEADAAELDRDIESARNSEYTSAHEQARIDREIARTLRECATALSGAIARELAGKAADDAEG